MFIAKNHWSSLRSLVLHYTLNAWLPVGLFLDILLLPCVVETLHVRSLHMLQQITDGVDAGTGQVVTLSLGLGSCRVGLPDRKWGQLANAHDFRGDSSTPTLSG